MSQLLLKCASATGLLSRAPMSRGLKAPGPVRAQGRLVCAVGGTCHDAHGSVAGPWRSPAISAGGEVEPQMLSTINSTNPTPTNRTASATKSYSSQCRYPQNITSIPIRTPLATVSFINVYRTLVSGRFRRKDFGFVVCGENLASISRFVARIRHGRQHLAGVEDYMLTEAEWREAIARWPEATIILR